MLKGEASLNRTHASFLNSLAGPEKRERIRGGREIKESLGAAAGRRRRTEGLLNAGSTLNTTACAEKLQFITIPSAGRACTYSRSRSSDFAPKNEMRNGEDFQVPLSVLPLDNARA